MTKPGHIRVIVTFFIAMGIVFSLAGCGTAQNGVTFSYTLPIIPVTFALDSNGNISVSAAARLVTELGEFAVSAGSAISAMVVPNDSLMLTIRHQENGNLVDTVYQINTGVVGSADIQGNISEVRVAWNGQNNSIFVDASNGDVSSITIQGDASSTTNNVPATIPTNQPTPVPSFQCPDAGQVSSWMNVNVSPVTNADACAFHAGDIPGQTLSSVICTNQDGGTSIEYTPVSEPKTLVVATCDGGQLPKIYGFTIRFLAGYPASGPYSANVCAIAQAARNRQGPDPIPSDWTVQAPC